MRFSDKGQRHDSVSTLPWSLGEQKHSAQPEVHEQKALLSLDRDAREGHHDPAADRSAEDPGRLEDAQ